MRIPRLAVVPLAGLVLALAACGSSGSGSVSGSDSALASSSISPPAPGAIGPPAAASTDASASVAGFSEAAPIDLKVKPVVSGKGVGSPTKLEVADVVKGAGAAATSKSLVTFQYVGLNFADGTEFGTSWGQEAMSPVDLASGLIEGVAQGIAGNSSIVPMRVGGRRIVVIPSADGYGATPPSGSPLTANENLVFVIDLLTVASS